MQIEKDENKEGSQNTSTRELFVVTPSDELPAERLLDIEESDKDVQQTKESSSDQ
ncbi:MAG TPA: hypothetical protein VFT06_01585 [Flavisolibacter sp.]|nr:hypothetical protein [Flavisolibacter sp.]